MTNARGTAPPAAPVRRSLRNRLGARLAFAVGLALTPLTVLAYLQARSYEARAVARAEQALLGQTQLAAAPLVEQITDTAATAKAMAAIMPALADRPGACTAAFRQVAAMSPAVLFAGFVPLDGLVTCSSTGAVHYLPDTPARRDLIENPRPVLTVNAGGAVTGQSVLILSHPVWDDEGLLRGFVSISLAHRALNRDLPVAADSDEADLARPLALATFAADGTVLTAALGIETVHRRLPADRPLAALAAGGTQTFTTRNAEGELRSFAVVPVAGGRIHVLGARPPAVDLPGAFGGVLPIWLFPLLLWAASLAVAWIMAEQQVLRHVRVLRGAIVAFAGGQRSLDPPDLHAAPDELRDVGDAFARMAEGVLHDEATLEDALHQKEVLLREVHHRVKNNLQLIASIMNIQMRKASSPEARRIVRALHERVMSLAMVHRELYQTSGVAEVQADELLSGIVALLMRVGDEPGRQIRCTTDLDPIRLTPDQTVPLSLALSEAMTNALKYARPDATGTVSLAVALKRTAEAEATLRVTNSAGAGDTDPAPADADSTGLGAQLMQAFAMQLSGELQAGPSDEGYAMTLRFPLRAAAETGAGAAQEGAGGDGLAGDGA